MSLDKREFYYLLKNIELNSENDVLWDFYYHSGKAITVDEKLFALTTYYNFEKLDIPESKYQLLDNLEEKFLQEFIF